MSMSAAPAPAVPAPPLLAVITNGGSTHNRAEAGWITPYLEDQPGVLQFHAHGPDQIRQAVRDAAAAEAEIIAVNGGDGTADLIFGALLNNGPFSIPPAVAILPAGKTNMTAGAWCGAKDKRAAIERLLYLRRDRAYKSKITPRPVLTLSNGENGEPLRGAFLGAADVVDGILFCRKHLYPLGLPNAFSHAVAICVLAWRSLFVSAGSSAIVARWDDAGGEEGRFFFLGAMTLDKLIVGLKPQPAQGEGGLHYMSLGASLRAILAALPRFAAKTVPPGYRRNVRRARKLQLTFDGAYTLDGELYEARRGQPLTVTADDTLPMIDLRP